MERPKLLFIGSGPAMPRRQYAYRARFEWLSRWSDGYIITPVTGGDHLAVRTIGSFRFLPYQYYFGGSVLRNAVMITQTLRRALALQLSGRRIDVVISSNPLTTGLLAIAIAKLVGAKSVIEVNGNFDSAFKFGAVGAVTPGVTGTWKQRIGRQIASIAISKSDMVKSLYSGQLRFVSTKRQRGIAISQFPNFVPISRFLATKTQDRNYILLLGHPWYLKGVDILIQAFNLIAKDFPRHSLKIVGWCPSGREYYEELANGNLRIELSNSVYYEKVPELIGNCSLFVLASRTEAMGRVLLEAMACRKPIIASNVDGIPAVIKNGYNGMLFESENYEDLARKMRAVLGNRTMANRLAQNARVYVQQRLSEERYTENYRKSIEQLLDGADHERIRIEQ